MKGHIFNPATMGSSLDKRKVKSRVVPNQDRARAEMFSNLSARGVEDLTQRFAFFDRHAERMKRVDLIELQRTTLKIGTGKRLYVERIGGLAAPTKFWVNFKGNGGDFKQGVGMSVKTTRLGVNDDGQEAAKAAGDDVVAHNRRGARKAAISAADRHPIGLGVGAA